jgi:hypothetical protein
MRYALVAIAFVHGSIHALGFLKAFGFARLERLELSTSRPLGALWLVAGVLFIVSAVSLVALPRQWWAFAAPALVLSQALILHSWSAARFGTIPNVVVLVPVALALLDLRGSSLRSMYATEVRRGVTRAVSTSLVTDEDVAKAPRLLQAYLRHVGVVGRPRVHDFRARFAGEMRAKPGADWMSAHAEQYSFFDVPTRLFLMDASLHGLPFQAYHRYVGSTASMRVRTLSLVELVDASGPEMNQSETVTLFNDMCLLAPATLLYANVLWEDVDRNTLRATFTNGDQRIVAELIFDDEGDLVSFVSSDRYQSADGKTYVKYPWVTPVREYGSFGGQRLARKAEAIWRQPDGDYVYGRFTLEEIEYNVTAQTGKGRRAGPLARGAVPSSTHDP